MKRSDLVRLAASVALCISVLAGVNPGRAQPWIALRGFRVEAVQSGIGISAENHPGDYSVITPTRDAWVFPGDRIEVLAGYEDFNTAEPNLRAGGIDLFTSALGRGRPAVRFETRKGGGTYEASSVGDQIWITKTVALPPGDRPLAFRHSVAPGPGHQFVLEGQPVDGEDGASSVPPQARRALGEGARVTIVSIASGLSFLLEPPANSRVFLNRQLSQIDIETPFVVEDRMVHLALVIDPLPRRVGQ